MEVMMGLFSRNKKKDKNNEYGGYIPASQRGQNYSGYNDGRNRGYEGGYNGGGYDERPGRGREDERNRGYEGGGNYNGGYDERPGRGREDDRNRGYNDGGYGSYGSGYGVRPGQGREDDRNRGYNDGGYGGYNGGGYDERPGQGREDDRNRGYNDSGYGGYNGGYDERPGQGRGDERNRGYNDGGYSGGYDERPGRSYDDYGYDNRRDAAYGQPGAVNGAYGTERDEWGMRNPAEPVNNREQPADHERPGEAARRFLELLDQKDIHYSFRKLQDSFDQIQAVFTGNDIPEVILNFVFDDEDGAVTIQVGDIVPQLYDGQRSRALDVVNALNCQYTFGTFTINDDNDIKFRIDALITPENAASTCYALMVKALKICDESYMRFLHM